MKTKQKFDIRRLLHDLRQQGLTQQAIADYVTKNCNKVSSQAQVSRWENGQEPRYSVGKAIEMLHESVFY